MTGHKSGCLGFYIVKNSV